MKHLLLLAVLLSLSACAPSCSTTVCGPGTRLENGSCVPSQGPLTCGPGTRLEGTQCVPDSTGGGGTDGGTGGTDGGTGGTDGGTGGTDGGTGGTDGGNTDSGTALTCGPGTHQQGSQCLPGDPIDTIVISPQGATLRSNQTTRFAAVAQYRGITVESVTFSWSSSSPGTATVDANGVATGVAVGTTQITASARGVTSAPVTLTVEPGPAFRIDSLQPTSGPAGSLLTLNGTRFGLTQGSTQVLFGTTAATEVLSWSNTRIVLRVPVGLSPGQVQVSLSEPAGQSNSAAFTVTSTPYVLSVSPRLAVQDSKVTLRLSGTNLASCAIRINRNGDADSNLLVDSSSRINDRLNAPGQPDLVRVNVEVGASAALGDLAVSCGASTVSVEPENRFTVRARAGMILASVGSGVAGVSGDGFAATSARLNGPTALALGSSGELYIADTGNNRVRVANLSSDTLVVAGMSLTPGTVATVAGGGGQPGDTTAGYSGDGGPASQSRLDAPSGLAYDARGLLFIADTGNHCVRVINLGATAVTLPGVGAVAPGHIALVGGAGDAPGYAGDGGAALPGSRFNGPMALAVQGNGLLYVADTGNHRVRAIHTGAEPVANGVGTFSPGHVVLVAGSSTPGSGGDDNPASDSTQLNTPSGLALDSSGLLYVADTGSNKVRVINTTPNAVVLHGPPGGQGGLGTPLAAGHITTAVGAGGAAGFSGEGWCGAQGGAPYPGGGTINWNIPCSPLARLAAPVGLATGVFGQLFIADQNNNRVRLAVMGDSPVRRAGKWFYAGAVDTLAGNGTTSPGAGTGDLGPATSASLFGPLGVAWSPGEGALYIADTLHNRVRKVVVELVHEPYSGEQGGWPADFTVGSATLNVDTGILSYNSSNGPAERRFGVTNGVFSFTGNLRLFPGTVLTLVGSQPAVLAATGNVQVDGTIIVNNGGLPTGPGNTQAGGNAHGVRGVTGYNCERYFEWHGGNTYGNAGLRPVTPGTGAALSAGALVLSAGTPGSPGDVRVAGEIRADSGSNFNHVCTSGGSGGGVRLAATGQVSVTGTITARPGTRSSSACCVTTFSPAATGSLGRIRLEAPVVSATGTLDPAPSLGTTAPASPPWL